MSNQYNIFAYRIPDAIVYFNNKIKKNGGEKYVRNRFRNN